jgi:translation initiation factor IF-3
MALPNRPFNRPSGPGGFKGKFMPRKEAEHRINHFIRVPQVRLVGDNVTMGVYPTQEALKMAQQLGRKRRLPKPLKPAQ